MKVYELIADAVAAEGVEAVFAVMGDGNMKWLVALEERHDVRVIHCRNEPAAAGMAEGYARLTGRPCVCTVTCGPGLALIATTLIIASRNRTPLVVIAGDAPRADRFYQQRFDQSRFAETAEAVGIDLRDERFAAEDVQAAFASARAGQPAVFSAAFDVQDEEVTEGRAEYRPAAELVTGQQAIGPDPAAIEAAARALAAAERPAILAGRGAIGARDAVVELAERTNALLVTTMRAKGLFAGHPRDLDLAGGLETGRTRALLEQSDCLLAIGAALNQYTTHNGSIAPAATLIQVSVEREELPDGRRMPVHRPAGKRRADCYVQADAGSAVRALLAALPRAERDGWAEAIDAYSGPDLAQPPVELAPGTIHPRDAMLSLSRLARPETRFAIGLGHFWQFPLNFLSGRDASSYLMVPEFGAIGQAFAAAMGAAFAEPERPVVLIEGDGSLMYSIQELDTAVRYGLDLLVLVMNDNGFAAEFHKLDGLGIDSTTARTPSPDFAAVAQAFGARAARAESLAELESAIVELQSAGGPALIDARISDRVINDSFWNAFFAEERRAAY